MPFSKLGDNESLSLRPERQYFLQFLSAQAPIIVFGDELPPPEKIARAPGAPRRA
jgi:hypothetical protein